MKNTGKMRMILNVFMAALFFLNRIGMATQEEAAKTFDYTVLEFAGSLNPIRDPNPGEKDFKATQLFFLYTDKNFKRGSGIYAQASTQSIEEFLTFFVKNQPLSLFGENLRITYRFIGNVESRKESYPIYRIEIVRVAGTAHARFILNADKKTLLGTFGGKARLGPRKIFQISNYAEESFGKQVKALGDLPKVVEIGFQSPENPKQQSELRVTEIRLAAPVRKSRGIVALPKDFGHCSDDAFDAGDGGDGFGLLVPLTPEIFKSAKEKSGQQVAVQSVCALREVSDSESSEKPSRCGGCQVATHLD